MECLSFSALTAPLITVFFLFLVVLKAVDFGTVRCLCAGSCGSHTSRFLVLSVNSRLHPSSCQAAISWTSFSSLSTCLLNTMPEQPHWYQHGFRRHDFTDARELELYIHCCHDCKTKCQLLVNRRVFQRVHILCIMVCAFHSYWYRYRPFCQRVWALYNQHSGTVVRNGCRWRCWTPRCGRSLLFGTPSATRGGILTCMRNFRTYNL